MAIEPDVLEEMVGTDVEFKEAQFGQFTRSITGKLAKTPAKDHNKSVSPFSVVLSPKQDAKEIPYVPIPLKEAKLEQGETVIIELDPYKAIPSIFPTVCCQDTEYSDFIRLYR